MVQHDDDDDDCDVKPTLNISVLITFIRILFTKFDMPLNKETKDFDMMRIVHTAIDACQDNRMKVIKTETFNVGFTLKNKFF